MKFSKGDKVTVIDEELSGLVLECDAKWITFECEDGFQYRYPISAVYRIEDEEILFEIPKAKFELKEEDRKPPTSASPIRFKGSRSEFDLHMESLFPDRLPIDQNRALQFQLDYAEAVVQKAMHLRVRRFVFIHGMGQGVLRESLRNMLSEKYPNIEYFDGNYQQYGQGATEIIIHGLGSK